MFNFKSYKPLCIMYNKFMHCRTYRPTMKMSSNPLISLVIKVILFWPGLFLIWILSLAIIWGEFWGQEGLYPPICVSLAWSSFHIKFGFTPSPPIKHHNITIATMPLRPAPAPSSADTSLYHHIRYYGRYLMYASLNLRNVWFEFINSVWFLLFDFQSRDTGGYIFVCIC